MKQQYITDLFKQFCKDRHAEDKGKNFDLLQEVYSKTELFDLSLLDLSMKEFPKDFTQYHHFEGVNKETLVIHSDRLKDFVLPFEVVYCKLPDNNGVSTIFMREYSPTVVTGTNNLSLKSSTLNTPFQIDLEKGILRIDVSSVYKYANWLRTRIVNEEPIIKAVQMLISSLTAGIYFALLKLNSLPKHSVACDRPKKAEYYTRKHSSTIKVIKPIYYVMDKREEKNPVTFKRIKPLGSCAFDHSFRVRGHWRHIGEKTYGKDRNGVYNVLSYTWVKEHVKGEGDLVQKVRVLK